MAKKAIQLKDYLVPKGKNAQGIQQTGQELKKCIVNVSQDLYEFLGAPEYIPTEGTPIPIARGTNVKFRSEMVRGTFHGKTVIIGTDGLGADVYKKTYQLQVPSAYPVTLIREWLEERQASTGNAISYVKFRNGFRYSVPVSTTPNNP